MACAITLFAQTSTVASDYYLSQLDFGNRLKHKMISRGSVLSSRSELDAKASLAKQMLTMDRARAQQRKKPRTPVPVGELFDRHRWSGFTPSRLKDELPVEDWHEIESLDYDSEAVSQLVDLITINLARDLQQLPESDVALPIAAQRFLDQRRSCMNVLPLYIIAAYLYEGKLPVKVAIASAQEELTVHVPRAYPSSVYLIDIRDALAKMFGVPHYTLNGDVYFETQKLANILNNLTYPRSTPIKLPEPTGLFGPDPEQNLVVKLPSRIGNSISWDCSCASQFLCTKSAYLFYPRPMTDPIKFCTANKDYLNLQTLLKNVLSTRYTDHPVEFLCKDCSKKIHPEWCVGNFFESEDEMSTLFDPSYCGCYKKDRTWKRSIIANPS